MPDGSDVYQVRLSGERLAVDVLTFGAVIRDIVFAGRSMVLGCDTLNDYVMRSPHFGAIVGRCANRIARGHLSLDGTTHQLTLNEGRNHLHGGAPGFSRRNWTLVENDSTSVTLKIVAEDGEQGYPGQLTTLCRYSIVGPGVLEIALEATTDRTTIVNLANHTYFNLSGADTIDDHQVRIIADTYLPVDDENIPTGALEKVLDTRFDLRIPRVIGGEQFDAPFVTGIKGSSHPRPLARAMARRAGVSLDILSTEPNLQFYTGHNIKLGTPGRGGRQYKPRAGLCFEAQGFPDAINHPTFPSTILRPDQTYRQITQFKFSESGEI